VGSTAACHSPNGPPPMQTRIANIRSSVKGPSQARALTAAGLA
jgi:hypothetical protein